MGTNKAAGEKTEDWKKQASGDERKMKWNRKLKMGIKNGSNGARTHDLSRVRRTLIPAELCFHKIYYSTLIRKVNFENKFFYSGNSKLCLKSIK